MVFFNIYDLSVDPLPKYPISVVKMDIDTSNIVRPLYLAMSATSAGGAAIAKANIYYFKVEWERVGK